MSYIEHPNLPENNVTDIIISESAGEAIKKLYELGIKSHTVKSYKELPAGISSHADLQFLHVKDNTIYTVSGNEHLYDCFEIFGLETKIIKTNLKKNYPGDVPLNVKFVGKNIIMNRKTVCEEIINFANKYNYNIINVPQGYSGCSVCVLNDKSIITDDRSIFSATQFFLDDVTLVEKNSIRLYGYNYGFIGGCCGKIGKNCIAFNGELSSHSDCNKIADALQRNKITAIELKKGYLEDIGSIIPILEK